MSGLIILFWFVADAVALRYFVSILLFDSTGCTDDGPSDTIYWRHVLHVRPLGRHRYVSPPRIS